MTGKDKESLEQKIPLPPEVHAWQDYTEMHYDFPESEDRQEEPGAEEVHSSEVSDNQMTKDASTPLENQIVGHNEAQDRYAQTVSITLSDQQEKQRT